MDAAVPTKTLITANKLPHVPNLGIMSEVFWDFSTHPCTEAVYLMALLLLLIFTSFRGAYVY